MWCVFLGVSDCPKKMARCFFFNKTYLVSFGRWGASSYCFPVVGDKRLKPIVGVYIPRIRISLLKVGWVFPKDGNGNKTAKGFFGAMDGATKEGSISTALDVWSYPDWCYVLTKFDPIFGENSACWDEGLPPDRGLAFTKGVFLSNTPKKLLGFDWWKHCEGLCYFPFLVSKASLFDVSKAAFLVSLFSLWWSLDQLNLISFPRKLHRCTGFRIAGKIEDCDLSPWFWRKIKFHCTCSKK